MPLQLQHFDPVVDRDLDIQEEVQHCLAEKFYPGVEWSVGALRDGISSEDLEAMDDRRAEFASGSRIYCAPEGTNAREQLFPNPSDGAAYGSLPFTPCQNLETFEGARILVIDDETGANGGLMPEAEARQLVGDCYGKISADFHNRVGGEDRTPFQFRLGIAPDENNENFYIAKGTIAPRIGYEVRGCDMILPTSAFKGRKPEPGIHEFTAHLGLKTNAYYNKQSLGPQVLVNYPKGVEADILPRVQQRLQELDFIAKDPRAIAADYLANMEARDEAARQGDEEGVDISAAEDNPEERTTTTAMMREVIGADANYYAQLLEHPKVVDTLNEYLKNQYRDCAIGRSVKFDAGLLQPSLQLKENEFCNPNLEDGEKVIVTRSPLVNSNGVIPLQNRHVPGLDDKGCVYMNPKTAADFLQGDFDGDRVAFAKASDFPTLAAEVEEKNQPQNRYPDIVKQKKLPYEGTFEQIAVSARENSIGLIATKIMRSVALEQECRSVPEDQKRNYLSSVLARYSDPNLVQYAPSSTTEDINKLQEPLADLLSQKIKEEKSVEWKEVKAIVNTFSDTEVNDYMKTVANVHRSAVASLGNELQVAVDGPKSARRPDSEVIKAADAVAYRKVEWLEDYKKDDIYKTEAIRTENNSPVDRLVAETNKVWDERVLEPRQTFEFRGIFEGVNYTPSDEKQAREIRDGYNQKMNYAHALREEQEKYPGARLKLISPKTGKTLELVNVEKYKHPAIFKDKAASVDVEGNWFNGKYYVHLQGKGEGRCLGQLSEKSIREHGESLNSKVPHQNRKFGTLTPELIPAASQDQIRSAFAATRDFADRARNAIPDERKERVAAAIWDASSTKKKEREHNFGKSSAAFAVFGPEIAKRCEDLQFDKLVVTGIDNRHFKGEEVEVRYAQQADTSDRDRQVFHTLEVNGKTYGSIAEESGKLPVGTTARATIATQPGAGAMATTPNGGQFKISQLKNFDLADEPRFKLEGTVRLESARSPNPKQLKPVVVARMGTDTIGVVADKEMRERGLQVGQQYQVSVEREPPKNAAVQIIPESVKLPTEWKYERHAETARNEQLQNTEAVADKLKWFVEHKGRPHKSQAEVRVFESKESLTGFNYKTNTLTMVEKGSNQPIVRATFDPQTKRWQPEALLDGDRPRLTSDVATKIAQFQAREAAKTAKKEGIEMG